MERFRSLRKLETKRTIHEVERGTNLDLILRGFNGAINRLADGLHAIALALSTPQDNSAEVQKKLDEYATRIDNAAAEQQAAIEQFNQSKEN